MDYELTELEHLVSVLINPAHLASEKLTAKLFNQYALDCYNEVEKIKKRFRVGVLKIADEKQITLYIHQHQACLIRFADTIYLYLKSNELEKPEHLDHARNVVAFYEAVYKDLEDLLLFLEKNFIKYFDIDSRLNWLCHEFFAKEIKNSFDQIEIALKKHSVSSELIEIAKDPLEILQTASSAITYRKRNYLQVLTSEMLELIANNDHEINNEKVCNELLSLNYNNNRFFNYLVLQFTSVAKGMRTNDDLIAFFSLKMKLLNQLPPKPKLVFSPELPDIRQQIGTWIGEELYLLEKNKQLSINPYNEAEHANAVQKIHTSLPVSQLSLALKLLVESGIIVNNNYTDLTKIVANSFRTDRSENISEDSLRNKYYNVEKATAEKMKQVVQNLLSVVRKY